MVQLVKGNLCASLQACFDVLSENVKGKSLDVGARSTAGGALDGVESVALSAKVVRLIDDLPERPRALYRLACCRDYTWLDYCVLFECCWEPVQPLLESKSLKVRDRLAALRMLAPHEAGYRLRHGKPSPDHGPARLRELLGRSGKPVDKSGFKSTYAPVWGAMVDELVNIALEYDEVLSEAVDDISVAEADFECAA